MPQKIEVYASVFNHIFQFILGVAVVAILCPSPSVYII
ncbi:hypothetical protein GFS31_01670 [Leptolyngbya sp. BL0902]|nr:hypothetical protein GFS31_01670 [Leptolyngbya sp. BL0902]